MLKQAKELYESVQAEALELEKKLKLLENFIKSKDFSQISGKHRDLLRNQKTSMKNYLDILGKRMKLIQKEYNENPYKDMALGICNKMKQDYEI